MERSVERIRRKSLGLEEKKRMKKVGCMCGREGVDFFWIINDIIEEKERKK